MRGLRRQSWGFGEAPVFLILFPSTNTAMYPNAIHIISRERLVAMNASATEAGSEMPKLAISETYAASAAPKADGMKNKAILRSEAVPSIRSPSPTGILWPRTRKIT